ncbi:MAG: class I SAM-dependent methyltransferase [Ignavibacteria bacterium]|nr:class I SAM-dependent methyltransferase [Ignavibacteria bacterium]
MPRAGSVPSMRRSCERARARLLETRMMLGGADVLDLGAGVGGTSAALVRRGARVTAVDSDPKRVDALRALNGSFAVACGDAGALEYPDARFDAVVLQDVIEHCDAPATVLREAARVLRPGGMLYLSTPSRFSVVNVLADPHWGLPLLSLLRRPALRRAVRVLRPRDAGRGDLAQLFSLHALLRLLRDAGFEPALTMRAVVNTLFETPEAVVWSAPHLAAVRVLRRTGTDRIVRAMASDRPGFINALLAPSWHLVCGKGGG